MRAVAIVGIVAVIAGAWIVAVIPVIGVVAVIAVIVEAIAVSPPIWGVDHSESAAEMPRTRMGPAAVKPTAIPVKSPPVMSGIGHRWMNDSGSKKQYRRGTPERSPNGLPGSVINRLIHRPIPPNRATGPPSSRAQLLPNLGSCMWASAFSVSNDCRVKL